MQDVSLLVAQGKMVEAHAKRDQFQGWTDEQLNYKMRRLADVIRAFKPMSFGFSVSCKVYYSEVRPVADRGLGNPYFPCAFSAISGIARFLNEQQIRVPVDFIFDDQPEISADINLFFEFMKEHLPRGARDLINGNPIFRDDKLFLPLQAADMLAWHTRRQHDSGNQTAMVNFLRNPDGHLMSEIDDATLRHWSTELATLTGGQPRQSKREWRAVKRGIARALSLGFVPPYGSRWKNALYGARKLLARFIRF